MEICRRRLLRPATALVAAVLAVSMTAHSQDGVEAVQPRHGHEAAAVRLVAAATMAAAESDYAARVVALVNKRRVDHGVKKVKLSSCVQGFAVGWATHLSNKNLFQHSDLMKLVKRCEVPYASENIAQVSESVTPRQLVSLWMGSPDHRHNILSKKPTHTGVGIRWDSDRQVWVAVQNFTKRPGSYSG